MNDGEYDKGSDPKNAEIALDKVLDAVCDADGKPVYDKTTGVGMPTIDM